MQAGDSELKQELGRLVDIEVWESAKTAAAEQLKAARQSTLQLEREQTVRQSILTRLQAEVDISALLMLCRQLCSLQPQISSISLYTLHEAFLHMRNIQQQVHFSGSNSCYIRPGA